VSSTPGVPSPLARLIAPPSGAELARLTGFCPITCRRALHDLVADSTLVRGVSPNARPRVAATATPAGDTARSLSGAVAALRRAAGLSQPALAALTGYSVTTVGHAETVRLWQARAFWEKADLALAARETVRWHALFTWSRGAVSLSASPAAGARPPRRRPRRRAPAG